MTFIKELSFAFIPRTIQMGVSLAQPYMVNASILYISNHRTKSVSYGYGLIGAYAIVYFITAVRLSQLLFAPSCVTNGDNINRCATDGKCTFHFAAW